MHHRIYIDRLFPNVREKNLQYKLKIDYESIMYVTIPQYTSYINKIIIHHLNLLNLKPEDITITDIMAGVGGDTIAFAHKFKHVNSIEQNNIRYNYLANNVCAYKLDNVKLYCDDFNDIIYNLDNQDVIFMDPPWGGKNYKTKNMIQLFINDIEIEKYCKLFSNSKKIKCIPKIIVLKLPTNYDINFMKTFIDESKIYTYNLRKMLIVVINI